MKVPSRHDIANLRKLADRQDSLFPFSYVQFYVISLTSSRDILVSEAVARGDSCSVARGDSCAVAR